MALMFPFVFEQRNMARRVCWLVAVVCGVFVLSPALAEAKCTPRTSGCERPDILRVPSADFPTIQSAVDAAADGATILIGPGSFRETITVAGKRLRIIGNGARGAGDLVVKDVVIARPGRGILWQSTGRLLVKDVLVNNPLWHGIVGLAGKLELVNVGAQGGTAFAVYITSDLCATLSNLSVLEFSKGGVAVVDSCALIFDSYFNLNKTAHIWSKNSTTLVLDSEFLFSLCVEQPGGDCAFGDSIVFLGGSGSVVGSSISFADGAAVAAFGASVGIGSTSVWCCTLDFRVETFAGVGGQLHELDQNYTCACALTGDSACLTVSSGVAPPAAIDP